VQPRGESSKHEGKSFGFPGIYLAQLVLARVAQAEFRRGEKRKKGWSCRISRLTCISMRFRGGPEMEKTGVWLKSGRAKENVMFWKTGRGNFAGRGGVSSESEHEISTKRKIIWCGSEMWGEGNLGWREKLGSSVSTLLRTRRRVKSFQWVIRTSDRKGVYKRTDGGGGGGGWGGGGGSAKKKKEHKGQPLTAMWLLRGEKGGWGRRRKWKKRKQKSGVKKEKKKKDGKTESNIQGFRNFCEGSETLKVKGRGVRVGGAQERNVTLLERNPATEKLAKGVSRAFKSEDSVPRPGMRTGGGKPLAINGVKSYWQHGEKRTVGGKKARS